MPYALLVSIILVSMVGVTVSKMGATPSRCPLTLIFCMIENSNIHYGQSEIVGAFKSLALIKAEKLISGGFGTFLMYTTLL